MPKNKRNWDKIRTQSNADSARYRDVYEDQQLDRKRIEKPQTMTSRTILAVVAGLLVALGLWLLVGAVEMTGALDGVNAGWKKTFFSKDGVDSPYQYVTLRDAAPKFEEDGVTPVLDESGEQVYDYAYTKYIWYSETGVLTDIQNSKWPAYTACEQAWLDDSGNLQYGIVPEKDADGNPVYPDGYLEAIETKKAALEAMETKPRMFLILSAPDGLEVHPDFLGKVDGYGFVFRSTAAQAGIDYDGKYNSGDEVMLGSEFDLQDPVAISEHGFEPGKNANLYMRLNRGKPQDTSDSMFHESFFDMRLTPVKLFLSLLGFMAMFGILYMVLKKNLAAMNILSDTSDINQHFNDQHIALPEEVQSLYDIFPDVGAHSSVMVSSMISHQAITNKGLKKVRLAKRADKDILDEDGDVEVYKGDILRDEHGEPITVEVPMIDTKFTEALFDSSKVPSDKGTRKAYDAPAIPYNPGDANLDKLKGYNTVAELINGDWEFPVYEPQRPGGVYIVDTAPVNTIKFNYMP